jgi:DNA-binding NtrC family response regulator
VRELQHIVERAALLARGSVITNQELELGGGTAVSEPRSLQQAKRDLIASFERTFIERLLRASGGNITHAAQAARKNRRAFFQLMRKYRIEPNRFRPLD